MLKHYKKLVCIFYASLFFLRPVYAAQLDPSDSTWGPLAQFVLSLFTGNPAIIASLIAFFMGIVLAMRTNKKLMALSSGLAIAVAFQLGPNLVQHLTGAVL